MSADTPLEELNLAERVLAAEPGAAEEFIGRYGKSVGDYLSSLCTTGVDREKTKEIVNGLFARCTSGRFLAKFKGKGSLEGWLKTIARHELEKHWKAEARNPVKVSLEVREAAGLEASEGMLSDSGAGEGIPVEIDLESFRHHLSAATAYAFVRLREEFPDRLAILRLATLHDIQQIRLAEVFGIDESEISRKKTDALTFLKSEIDTYLSGRFPRNRFTWGDLHEFARAFGEIAHDEDLASGA